MGILDKHDGFSRLRQVLGDIAADREEWAGIPMPLDDQRLVIEPTYPAAEALMRMGVAETGEDEVPVGTTIRNRFWSWRWRCEIAVWESEGRIEWGKFPSNRLSKEIQTLGASDAWGVEQEARAIDLLATMLPHRKFKQYMMTGMFLETSRRSGVCYLFRRLRPTVALSMRTEAPRVLAALCLHPIGYYADSWAGAMCPTDDVVAHLSLMRGDEVMFWRRANQHPAWRPEAAV